MKIDGLDEKDNQILEIIQDNARLSYQEIADRVGMSRVGVKNRMEKMQESGVIKSFQTVISPHYSPTGIQFFLNIDCVPAGSENVMEYLAENPTIRQIYMTSGDSHIVAVGFASSMEKIDHLVKILQKSRQSILRFNCQTVLSTRYDADGGVDYERIYTNEGNSGTDRTAGT